MYDYIIIGGGISGLYSCYILLKNNPKLKILIIEQSGRWGGRIYTKKRDGLSFESGAGRFHSSHINFMKLLKELNLYEKIVPLSKDVSYFLKNQWVYNDNHLMKLYNSSFKTIYDMWQFIFDNPPKDHSTTLYEHCKSIGLTQSETNCLKDTFGYSSEFIQLNAKNALDIIKYDFQKGQYYILNGGLQQVIDELVKRCKDMNAIMLLNTVCISVDKNNMMIEVLQSNNKIMRINSEKCILSVPISNLNDIKITPSLKWNKSQQPIPYKLCRIYAKYSEPWFKGMSKIITDKKISMIIPINPDTGLIMISYSDNKNADYWNSFDNNNEIKKELGKELRIIFPDINIPNPEWISFEYWFEGCHAWGKYSDDIMIMNNIQSELGPNIYLINEAYCHIQSWIEGSLIMSNQYLNRMNGGTLKYTMSEVSKHITNETGIWTVIDNRVYDITKWVPQHPGGRVAIMQIAGKDGSELYHNNPFHKGKNTDEILKKYYIGDLI